jgi:hypothetical protein
MLVRYATGATRLGIIYWAFSQLISYGVWPWVLFVATTLGAAYLVRVPGIFLGHVLVATAVVVFDVQWIQSEMRKPGWNGQPDQDFVFMIGVVLRILLINTVLLPVSFLALRLRRSGQSQNRALQRTGAAQRGLEVMDVAESGPGR